MSKYKKDISNTKVSALDSALKLLMDVYKKTRYFLGCLLIDNLLRSIVHWDDKRHKESILAEIKSKDNELSRLINEHNQMISQIAELRNENQKLLQRCLPETEIPSMIYYAQGDASS